jgi:hypothetical protein
MLCALARSKGWKGLAVAIGNLDAGLDVAINVHEAPFVFPLFTLFIVADLPWFVECREPAIKVSKVTYSPKKKPRMRRGAYQKYSVPFFKLGQTQSCMN